MGNVGYPSGMGSLGRKFATPLFTVFVLGNNTGYDLSAVTR
ncbi:UNVERIFIED_ORG: hypothetical protein DFS12_1011529 [Chitinophaga ginsengisegetis]|nr:hypothetical protein [Chitinophaga ginsengisegetis]MDR6646286.1 hypothetical protein [Chitinophaga ginsengisegetis]MDR6651121.1 hypothetical protein [Chitinophaga ginsengisegetis]